MVKVLAFLVFVAALLCAGCTAPGMNKKMGFSDAAAVTATAMSLDQAKNFDATKTKVIEVATALKEFVKTGSLGTLPLYEVEKAMDKFLVEKGWGQYTYIVDAAIAYVSSITLDTGVIGSDNVLLIETGLDGVIRQASRSKAEWATPLSAK